MTPSPGSNRSETNSPAEKLEEGDILTDGELVLHIDDPAHSIEHAADGPHTVATVTAVPVVEYTKEDAPAHLMFNDFDLEEIVTAVENYETFFVKPSDAEIEHEYFNPASKLDQLVHHEDWMLLTEQNVLSEHEVYAIN